MICLFIYSFNALRGGRIQIQSEEGSCKLCREEHLNKLKNKVQYLTYLTTQNKTKITLQAAHTHNSPTERSSRDVQQLTISLLHTKKVSMAGPGPEKEQALPQHHKSV